MGRLLFIVTIITLLITSCNRQKTTSKSERDSTTVEFLSDLDFEFGYIYVQDTLYHYFLFKNTGSIPFVIDKAESSCGCLKVDYPKYPIMPEATDSICFIYDGNGFDPGRFIKSCSIYSNAKGMNPLTLIIRGSIISD
jgi:hypothetical protein